MMQSLDCSASGMFTFVRVFDLIEIIGKESFLSGEISYGA